MAKNSGNEGCGYLILIALGLVVMSGGFAALGQLLYGAIGLGILGIVVFAVVKIISLIEAPAPSRTATHSTTWLGDKKKTIEYHDTGKEVQQITSSDWLGRKTNKTYVTKPGRQRQKVRYQTCNRCGSSVASTDGSYHCSCGRRWGRR